MKIPHHKQSKKAPNTEIINSLDYSYRRVAYLTFSILNLFGAKNLNKLLVPS